MKHLLPPDLKDLSTWPTVDQSALDAQRQADLLHRIEAVRLYVLDKPQSQILAMTGISGAQVRRLVRHCIEAHPDGRIRGFRALIPYARSKNYVRVAAIKPSTREQSAGSSGAMTALLERHGCLQALLCKHLADRMVFIGERNQLCGLHAAHHDFIKACRALGLGPPESATPGPAQPGQVHT